MFDCGPPEAPTVAANAEVRVYRHDRAWFACGRGAHTLALGRRVLGVTLAGRRVVVRRGHPVGEQLRMYDARRVLAREHDELPGTIEAVRVDRSGRVVFVVLYRDGERYVRTMNSGEFSERAWAPVSELRLARGQVAWREGTSFQTRILGGSAVGSRLLIHSGQVQVLARGRELGARIGRRRVRKIGETYDGCTSSPTCYGFDRVQIVGRFLRAHHLSNEPWNCCPAPNYTLVIDLETGGRRRVDDGSPGTITMSW